MPRLSIRADAGVGAIAVSPTNRDVVLAGRSGLHIVDLYDPFTLPRHLPLRSVWEVSNIKWSPHKPHFGKLVSSSNQKILIWNLNLPSEKAIENVLHGHRRAVTDINFSSLNNNIFATSSIDTTVKLWDMRQLNQTAITFADFDAGMLQCQFNPLNENLLATAQHTRIALWDQRKNNMPVVNFKAHESECNGLQYFVNGELISCSSDRTVKVWDSNLNINPKTIVDLDFPVWRALPTPVEFGALVVPLRGGKNRVQLIDLSSNYEKIAEFDHPNVVKSAVFMQTNLSSSRFDVVTWCTDLTLREFRGDSLQQLKHAKRQTKCKSDLVKIDECSTTFNTDEFDNLYGAGREMFELPLTKENFKISQYDWIAGVHVAKGGLAQPKLAEPETLASKVFSGEIISVSAKFPRVLFDEINIGSRTCVISLLGPWGDNGAVVQLRVQVKAHASYPDTPLKLELIECNMEVGLDAYKQLQNELNAVSLEFSQHGLKSLEFCVRYLVGDPVNVEDAISGNIMEPVPLSGIPETGVELSDLDLDDGVLFQSSTDEEPPIEQEIENDETSEHIIDSTPLPKSCGGVFAVTGQLICFFNHKPVKQKRGPLPLDKVFADGNDSDESCAPFMSDSDDFDVDEQLAFITSNWAHAAARLNANAHSSTGSLQQRRPRTRTITTATSEDGPSWSVRATLPTHTVVIHNMLHLWPCRPDLAREYMLTRQLSPLEMSNFNHKIALKYNLALHVHVWKMLTEHITSELDNFNDPFYALTNSHLRFEWAGGDVGFASFLPKLTSFLESKGEIQLLVGISMVLSALRAQCEFLKQQLNTNIAFKTMDSNVKTNFYATNGAVTVLGTDLPKRQTRPKLSRHGSQFNSDHQLDTKGFYFSFEVSDSVLFEFPYPQSSSAVYAKPKKQFNNKLIEWAPRLISHRLYYANLLHTWGLSMQRAEVTKPNYLDPLIQQNDIIPDCGDKHVLLEIVEPICVLCDQPILKMVEFCANCRHVMHCNCALMWWAEDDVCPGGCGCVCKSE